MIDFSSSAPEAPPASNVFSAECPARRILDLLAEKWVLLAVHALKEGPSRPGELRRRIEGISEKMLIQTLRRLQRLGIVARHSYPEVPPRVEYWLTPLGLSLADQVKAFDDWVETHASIIEPALIPSTD